MNPILSQIEERLRRSVEGAVIIAGEIVATEVRRNIQTSPRGGRTYIKENPSRTHTASAPGESPANDLGFLVRSIQVEPEPQAIRARVVSLAAIAPYAKKLEFGDLSMRLAPRPFFFKGLDTKKREAIDIVNAAVGRAIHQSQAH